MPLYIQGYSIQCAQGSGAAAVYPQLFQPRAPVARDILFLDQRLSVPYFDAFAEVKLAQAALIGLIERHLHEAVAHAGWPADALRTVPIFIGSTSYLMAACEQQFGQGPVYYSLNDVADYFAREYGNHKVFNLATSCTSSAHALLYAQSMMACLGLDQALVVGFESFNSLTFEHFQALGLLAGWPYVPFVQSDGLILGEGIACLAVGNQPGGAYRIGLRAAVSHTDTGSLLTTGTDSVYAVMAAALSAAGLSPQEIVLVKAHGVGSSSDEAEQTALNRLLPCVPVALFKPYVGHTLGASGLLELVLLLLCLEQQALPALPEPEAYAACALNVAAQGMPLGEGHYLLNCFGFGGSNVSWIIGWHR